MHEYFETYDEQGHRLGLVARDEVHRLGLWHRSAQVFVFTGDNRLLLQQRAADKDLYPGLWDYSVGEHVQPGESYQAAASRGLWEELGIKGATLSTLWDTRWERYQGDSFDDREIQQAFRVTYDGEIRPDPEEVAAVRYVSRQQLAAWMSDASDQFTPWFGSHIQRLDWL